MQFDISNFCPLITEDLLMAAINLTKNYCNITDQEINTIKQGQQPILYHNGSMWTKKDNRRCSIAIGAFDSA